jgi:hypothetical protein
MRNRLLLQVENVVHPGGLVGDQRVGRELGTQRQQQFPRPVRFSALAQPDRVGETFVEALDHRSIVSRPVSGSVTRSG